MSTTTMGAHQEAADRAPSDPARNSQGPAHTPLPTVEVGLAHPADMTSMLTVSDRAAIARAGTVGERAVLDELKHTFDSDPTAEARCHQLTHQLGREAYARRRNVVVAASAETGWCGGGYLHGVLEAWGRSVSLAAVSEGLTTVCAGVEPQVANICAHGLGHAIMQHTPELPAAFRLCDQLDRWSWDCMAGVMMLYGQTFIRPAILKASDFDVNSFCGLVPAGHLADCYFEAGTTWLNLVPGLDYAAAVRVCATLPGSGQAPCAEGVGGVLPDKVGLDGGAAVALCAEAGAGLARPCVSGASRNLRRLYLERGLGDFCGTIPSPWQATCRDLPTTRSDGAAVRSPKVSTDAGLR